MAIVRKSRKIFDEFFKALEEDFERIAGRLF
jgi:hypothetical protein